MLQVENTAALHAAEKNSRGRGLLGLLWRHDLWLKSSTCTCTVACIAHEDESPSHTPHSSRVPLAQHSPPAQSMLASTDTEASTRMPDAKRATALAGCRYNANSCSVGNDLQRSSAYGAVVMHLAGARIRRCRVSRVPASRTPEAQHR